MRTRLWMTCELVGTLTALLLASEGPDGEALALSCGDVVGPGTSVTLTGDLSCTTNPAIKVIGPAELNLGFHTITCINVLGQSTQHGVGIRVEGRGAHVHSGEVRGCSDNVELGGVKVKHRYVGEHKVNAILSRDANVGFSAVTDSNRLEDNISIHDTTGFLSLAASNRFADNYAEGIPAWSSRGFESRGSKTRFTGNTARNYYEGFFVGGEAERVDGNTAEDNETGFAITTVKARIDGNTATDNEVGFEIGWNKESQIYRNLAESNDTGFLVSQSSDDAVLDSNTATGNGFGFADQGFHTTFEVNTAENNDIGFYVFKKAKETVLYDNVARGNASHGIALSGKAARASKNHVEKNGQFGIYVTQNANSQIIYNTSTGNGAFDMKDLVPGCGSNLWTINTFGTSSQACIE